MASKPADFAAQIVRCKAHSHELMAVMEYLLTLLKAGVSLVQLHDWCWAENVGLVAEHIHDPTQCEAINFLTKEPEVFALWLTTKGSEDYFPKLYTEKISLNENKARLQHCGGRLMKATSFKAQVMEKLHAQTFDASKNQAMMTVVFDETGDTMDVLVPSAASSS
jgi:type II secretory pathway component PulF